MTGKSLIILFSILFFNGLGYAVTKNADDENSPVFSPEEITYDFGMIGENDGYAEHVFKFVNTGNAPLTILNVQTTCGCTRPEWTQGPIEPGKEGYIIVTFVPKGRIGPLNKTITVQTNESGGYKRHKLTILGEVVEKPRDPDVVFTDTIGGMGIEQRNFVFKTFNVTAPNKMAAHIKNYNNETVYFSWENVPDYMSIQAPDSLKAGWPGEIAFIVDGIKTAEKRGRITDKYVWVIKNREGHTLSNETLSVTVNYLDDFSNMSPLQTVSAPALEIKNTIIDFGVLKKGAFGMNKTFNKPILLTNTGKSDLIIHSLTVDDERLHLPDLKGKTIKVGETFTVNASLKSKEMNADNLDTEIYVVCNDPKGPVRLIKATAN